METVIENISEIATSTFGKLTLAAIALGAVPFYLLSMATASLTN